jgi:Na+:H+ antiporter
LPALFGLLGGLLVLAFAANRLFQWTRVPDVVVLMATGLVIGPLLHWVRGEQFQDVTHAFGTLALILILFGGGLELNIRETLRHFPGGALFGLVSYLATTALIGFLVHYSLRLPRSSAMLVGAVLGCTSATIVLPLLEQWNSPQPVKIILMVESALGDVLGVLCVEFLLEYQRSSGTALGRLVAGIGYEVGVSLAAAVGIGVLWRRLLPKLSEQRFWQVLTFSMVLLLYAGTEAAHASGLLAVLGFGLALANLPGSQPELRETMWGAFWGKPSPHRQIHDFHAELAFLVRTFFFVLIGVVVRLGGLERVWPIVFGVLGAIFLARWGAIQMSRWSWPGVSEVEREIVLWVMPRGLITVVLALEVLEAGGSEVAFLPALAFATILLTNIVVVGGSLRLRRGAARIPEAGRAGAPVAAEGR